MCNNGQQFGIDVEEMSIKKITKRVIDDLKKSEFISIADYISEEQEGDLFVKSEVVIAVLNMNISNIQVPNKNIFVPGPGGQPN